jgi:hypothetical protein
MKKTIRNFGILTLVCCLIFSCTGNPDAKKEETKVKKLSLDTKAKNTFKNTTVVFTGAMVLAFSEVYKGQAEAFAEAFNSELNEEDLKVLDEQIAGLGNEVIQPLEELIVKMNEAFDEMAKENITVYEKMFLHDLMKEGVAITEKYELPAGFRPLSQNLSQDEIKRYIVKVSSDGQDQDDPIIKTYMELFEWFQKVGEEFNADPEIQSFLKSMKD